MIDYYDKEGKPISREQYMELFANREYQRVALDEIGPYVVSTVWLGLDHQFGEGPPLIFETMVFPSEAWHADRSQPDHPLLLEDYCQRYSTETEALAGHHEVVTLIRATEDIEESNGKD